MSGFRLSPRTKVIAGVGTLVFLAFAGALLFRLGGEQGVLWTSDIGELLIVLTAAAVVLLAARALAFSMLGRPWLWIGLGIAAFGIGDIVWSAIELGTGLEVPYPGLPDVFYVLFYPLLTFGFYLAIRDSQLQGPHRYSGADTAGRCPHGCIVRVRRLRL